MKDTVVVKTYIEFPLLGFMGMGVLSSIVAQVPLSIVVAQLFLYIKGFFWFFVLANLTISEVQLKKYIKFFFFVSIFIFCLGLLDMVAPRWFRMVTGNILYIEYRSGFFRPPPHR